jgi:hypothetical protein
MSERREAGSPPSNPGPPCEPLVRMGWSVRGPSGPPVTAESEQA